VQEEGLCCVPPPPGPPSRCALRLSLSSPPPRKQRKGREGEEPGVVMRCEDSWPMGGTISVLYQRGWKKVGAARPGCPGRGERGGERMRMRCRRTHRHCKKRGLVFLALSSLSGCSGCQMASPNMDRLAPSCGTARNGFVFLSGGGKSRQGRERDTSRTELELGMAVGKVPSGHTKPYPYPLGKN
jgi:hypothetical protein